MITKGSRVRFVRDERHLPRWTEHCVLAKEYIELGKLYTVVHVYPGTPEQYELENIEPMLFLADMFEAAE